MIETIKNCGYIIWTVHCLNCNKQFYEGTRTGWGEQAAEEHLEEYPEHKVIMGYTYKTKIK